MYRQIDRQIDRQTDRQTDDWDTEIISSDFHQSDANIAIKNVNVQIDRQIDRQTDRQTDR